VLYHKVGLITAQLTTDARPTGAQRLQGWEEARAHQQRALDIICSLQQRDALADADASVPELLATEIARCDAMIARLKKDEPAAQPALGSSAKK
jgi:hypothetical protein